MSKGINQYGSQAMKLKVISRRLGQPESNRGLGYWSAMDARRHIAKLIAKAVAKEMLNEEPTTGSEEGRE